MFYLPTKAMFFEDKNLVLKFFGLSIIVSMMHSDVVGPSVTYPASPRTETPGIVLHSFSKGTLNILQLSNRLNPPGISDEPVAMIISSNPVSIQHFDFKELLQTVSCSRELLRLDQQALCKRAAAAERTATVGVASPRFALLAATSLP